MKPRIALAGQDPRRIDGIHQRDTLYRGIRLIHQRTAARPAQPFAPSPQPRPSRTLPFLGGWRKGCRRSRFGEARMAGNVIMLGKFLQPTGKASALDAGRQSRNHHVAARRPARGPAHRRSKSYVVATISSQTGVLELDSLYTFHADGKQAEILFQSQGALQHAGQR